MELPFEEPDDCYPDEVDAIPEGYDEDVDPGYDEDE